MYWAIEDVKAAERQLADPMAYRHVPREVNLVADDMARRALEKGMDVTYWNGRVPSDAPPNQLQEVYEQQGATPLLNWADLPEPVDWASRVPQVNVASFFRVGFAKRLAAVERARA